MFRFLWKLICLPFTIIFGFFRWYRGCYRGKPWWAKIIVAVFSFIVFVIFYAVAVQLNFLWLFGDSPSPMEIIEPKTCAASEVYSADGKLITKFYNENRTPVEYDEISPNFFKALVATEDERFYKHHGIDFVGLFAAAKDAALGHPRGASTITQQLVKNMHKMRSKSTGLLGRVPGVSMIIMKSKEMIIASEIEAFSDKRQILTMYANTVDFGSNAFGIKTASKIYFNTTPSELKVEEAAVLVGLLKATTAYNPKTNPENSKRRRNVVFDNMVSNGFLTPEEADSLKQLDIKLKYQPEAANEGPGLYFRQAVRKELKDVLPQCDPDIDGLKIYTTLDSRMQKYAEDAVRSHMRSLQKEFNAGWGNDAPWRDEHNRPISGFIEEKIKQTDTYKVLAAQYPNNPEIIREKLNEKHTVRLFSYEGKGYREAEMSSMDSLRYMLRFMHTGFVAIEPATGHVKAYVGDVDYKTWQHDKVQSVHQPGSTFKLFVYTTAIKNGLTPNDRRRDEAVEIPGAGRGGGVWRPQNANGKFSGEQMTLRTAFAHSVNSIAVKLGRECGIENIINTAYDMGIKTKLQQIPSLPLGASDVTPYELVSAYTTVANYGTHIEPICVTRVEDASGYVLYEARQRSHVALSEKEAFYVQSLLAAGVKEGTSRSLQNYIGDWYTDNRISIGGKTGTTNNHTDAWFVGVTPKLVAGAWVGGEYRQIHFRSGAQGQGAKAALPIVGSFFRKVLSNRELSGNYMALYHTPVGTDASAIRSSVPSEPRKSSDDPRVIDSVNAAAQEFYDELQQGLEDESYDYVSEMPQNEDPDDILN